MPDELTLLWLVLAPVWAYIIIGSIFVWCCSLVLSLTRKKALCAKTSRCPSI